MTRISLTEDYDDRSVISKLQKIEELDNTAMETAEKCLTSVENIETTFQEKADSIADAAIQQMSQQYQTDAGLIKKVADAADAVTDECRDVTDECAAALTNIETARKEAIQATADANLATKRANEGADQVTSAIASIDGKVESSVEEHTTEALSTLDTKLTAEVTRATASEDDKVSKSTTTAQEIASALTVDGAFTERTGMTTAYSATPSATCVKVMPYDDITAPTGRYYTIESIVDRNLVPVETKRFKVQSGGAHYIVETIRKSDGTDARIQTKLIDSVNGRVLYRGSTPNGDDASDCYVNQAYVSATDGTTNNLVHTIGNESIAGIKTFDVKPVVKRVYACHSDMFTRFVRVCTFPYNANYSDQHLIVSFKSRNVGYNAGCYFKVDLLQRPLGYNTQCVKLLENGCHAYPLAVGVAPVLGTSVGLVMCDVGSTVEVWGYFDTSGVCIDVEEFSVNQYCTSTEGVYIDSEAVNLDSRTVLDKFVTWDMNTFSDTAPVCDSRTQYITKGNEVTS